jgi:hypothetical protein
VKKQEGKRPSARPRHTMEDDIKNNLKETWLTWTELLWIRIWQAAALINVVKNPVVPESLGIFLTSWETISFSMALLYEKRQRTALKRAHNHCITVRTCSTQCADMQQHMCKLPAIRIACHVSDKAKVMPAMWHGSTRLTCKNQTYQFYDVHPDTDTHDHSTCSCCP